jgi:F-type H+-transporting ATPase subunit gamma
MGKARAIVKRRKAVRNIKKITRTMQMVSTAKFQKSLKRTLASKPYTLKVRELVRELAGSVQNVDHPLLRKPEGSAMTNRIMVVVITSNRGLCGAYNSNVLKTAVRFLKQQEAAGKTVELFAVGKKGAAYFNFQKRAIAARQDRLAEVPSYETIEEVLQPVISRFAQGELDAIHFVYMNFVSTGVQRPEVATILPLVGLQESMDNLAMQVAEKEAQASAGLMDAKRRGDDVKVSALEATGKKADYEFSPDAESLLNELLPMTVKATIYQALLDSMTSEHVARMVAMKSATDNADKMGKALALEYNRARQSQITTELAEIMGGVESMK